MLLIAKFFGGMGIAMRRLGYGLAGLGLTFLSGVAVAESLPLKPGVYMPGTPQDAAQARPDCQDPAALIWNGRGFEADYIYLDNVVKVETLGPGYFRVTSRTRVSDENTKKSGPVWLGEIKMQGPETFQFKQYSARQKPGQEEFSAYSFCKR